jgi:hypothetical protein
MVAGIRESASAAAASAIRGDQSRSARRRNEGSIEGSARTDSTRSSTAAGRRSGVPAARSRSTAGAVARCSTACSRTTSAQHRKRMPWCSASQVRRVVPPSGNSDQARPGSPANGASTSSGATSASTCSSPCSYAVPSADALSHTGPRSVGIRSAVAHGRTCGCSGSLVRASPSAASWSSTQSIVAARHDGSSQRSLVTPAWSL